MFDAEKLLGALLQTGFGSGVSRHGADLGLDDLNPLNRLGQLSGMPNKAALGLGVLGIAIAAYEHWQENRPQGRPAAGTPPPPPPPGPASAAPPPPPPSHCPTSRRCNRRPSFTCGG
jgi:hypothetical protein